MTHCGNVVGPVWKDGGESWACERPEGHEGWHKAENAEWDPSVGSPSKASA